VEGTGFSIEASSEIGELTFLHAQIKSIRLHCLPLPLAASHAWSWAGRAVQELAWGWPPSAESKCFNLACLHVGDCVELCWNQPQQRWCGRGRRWQWELEKEAGIFRCGCRRLLGNNTNSWCSVTKVGRCVNDLWKWKLWAEALLYSKARQSK
jgi:hypothetical protein